MTLLGRCTTTLKHKSWILRDMLHRANVRLVVVFPSQGRALVKTPVQPLVLQFKYYWTI